MSRRTFRKNSKLQSNMCKVMCFIHGFALVIFLSFMPTQSSTYLVRQRTGCYHNGTWFADKSFIPALENCLSCECKQKRIVCRRKVCPELPVPPPRGCIIVQKRNTCCPYLSCARLETYEKLPSTRRIIAYLDHYERESIDRVVNDNMLQRRSDDSDIDMYVCVKNGTVYKSGSAMSSSSMCTYCYCIGGTEKCVKPKCMLPVEGCKPIFVDSRCCPVRYDCSIKSSGKSSQEVLYRKTSNKHFMRVSQRLQRNRGCTVGKQFYAEGHKMKSDHDKPCDICFCIRGNRRCAPKKCSPPLKNCIPVVPKGQCCPSSYDCDNYQQDYDRADNSRQFNLFSFFFNDDNSTNNSNLPIEYPHDRNPGLVPLQLSTLNSTEPSFFDKIRQGLEFIDTNNEPLMEDSLTMESMKTTSPNTPNTSTSEMSLLDLLLQSDEKYRESAEKADEVQEKTTSSNILSWIDILIGNDENNQEMSTTLQPLDIEVGQDSTENPKYFVSPEVNESTTQLYSTTDFMTTSTDIKFLEDTTLSSYTVEDSTLSFSNLPIELKSSEETATNPQKSNSNKVNATKVLETINLTEKLPTKIISNVKGTTILPPTILNGGDPVINNGPASISGTTEKSSNFLSAFLDGITIILKEKNLNKSTNDKPNLKHVPEIKSNTLISDPRKPGSSTVAQVTPNPFPIFKPIPTQKSHTRINSKITHLSATAAPTIRSEIKNISIKGNKANYTTKIPIEIKTILEAEPFEHNDEPTLPPSLPNLKIIPFLPTDAVKVDRNKPNYEAYYNNVPIDKIDYDIFDDNQRYPSLVQPFPTYDNLQDGSKAEYIYKFNIEGPSVSTITGTSGVKINGFSPPTKTEGGFLPKESIRTNVLAVSDNDDFQSQKVLIDITTSRPLYESSTKAIDITTVDPFKDVIRTEPSPDLSSLIGQQQITTLRRNITENNNKDANSNVSIATNVLNTYSNLLLKKINAKSPLSQSTKNLVVITSTVPQFKTLPQHSSTIRPTLKSKVEHKTESTLESISTIDSNTESTIKSTQRKNSKPSTTERTLLNTKSIEMKLTSNSSHSDISQMLEIKPFMEASFEVNSKVGNINIKSGTENLDKNIVDKFKEIQKPTTNKVISSTISPQPPMTSVHESFGTLKLAGCNIYGRMYRVNRIIVELSNNCRECKCTEVGVECKSLDC